QALIRYLTSVSSDALSKTGRSISYQMYPKNPGAVRGLTAQVTAARFLKCEPIRVAKPVNDVEWIYRTYLLAENGMVVDLLERPNFDKMAQVSVDAVFLKMATYTGGNGPVQAPFLVGKSLKPFQDTTQRD